MKDVPCWPGWGWDLRVWPAWCRCPLLPNLPRFGRAVAKNSSRKLSIQAAVTCGGPELPGGEFQGVSQDSPA